MRLSTTVCAACGTFISASMVAAAIPIDFPASVTSRMDTNIAPCDDFYQYACGTWERDMVIPDDRGGVQMAFSTIQRRNELVIQELVQEDWPVLTEVYGSCMDEDTLDTLGNSPLQAGLERIVEAGVSKVELMHRAGELRRAGLAVITDISVGPDSKNATTNVLHVRPAEPTLPSLSYYVDTEGFAALELAFRTYIRSVLTLSGYLGNATNETQIRAAEDAVLAVDKQLAEVQVSLSKVSERDPDAHHHPITLANAVQRFPVTFGAFARGLGLLDAPVTSMEERLLSDGTVLIFQSLEYFERMETVLSHIPTIDLQRFLVFSYANFHARFLSSSFYAAYATFFDNTLLGRQTVLSRRTACIKLVEEYLPDLLGHYFSLKVLDQQTERDVEQMVELIEDAMHDRLASVSWLDDTTRTAARDKLSKVSNLIGKPSELNQTAHSYQLSRSTLFKNLETIATTRFSAQLVRIGTSVDKREWEISAVTANAYYTAMRNQIVLLAAILQSPIFDVSHTSAQNFGSLGAIIGHELSHGFDSRGRLYDGDGNKRSWWSQHSADELDYRMQCLAEQYSQFEVKGLENGELLGHVNGNRTITETLADNAGLGLAFDAYHRSVEAKFEDSEDQLFFVAFAQTFCSQVRDTTARRQLHNEHAPDRWRVNGAIMNSAAFAAAFHCQVDSRMNPSDKCQVW